MCSFYENKKKNLPLFYRDMTNLIGDFCSKFLLLFNYFLTGFDGLYTGTIFACLSPCEGAFGVYLVVFGI